MIMDVTEVSFALHSDYVHAAETFLQKYRLNPVIFNIINKRQRGMEIWVLLMLVSILELRSSLQIRNIRKEQLAGLGKTIVVDGKA